MNGSYFIDTNIIIYAFDSSQPARQARSRALIQDGLLTGLGVISTQVVQEFLNVATRKFAAPLRIEDAVLYLRQVLNPLCRVYPDLSLYERCLELQAETGYSFYDSLILAAALHAGCDILYSEDLQAGRTNHGLTIVNPLS
jgi:predicted nucleic acid-binding protein